ncbi:hypothetical protein CLAFUW4_04031 [Fulvia fulva]|nr:hypothetical protein CLAFUR4_04017 [Fulvia fulva]WPV14283.1 hypothetical protein CLAFUW4_04031 [Fulvia fulva]WPV29211.1 hypothetical protein CLAFUW7_04020 [Fulvia fulva]
MPPKRGSRPLAETQPADTKHSISKNNTTPRKPLQSISNNQQRTAPPPAKKRKSNGGIEIHVDEAPLNMFPTPPASQPAVKPRVERTVRGLPRYMLDVTAISLEEGLYSQAIALQSRLLETGLETNAVSRVPPPQHLALESTLTVHPTFNTKTIKSENKAASNDAMRYLRQLSRTTNPEDVDLKNAFHFTKGRAQSERSKRSRTRNSDVASDDEGERPGQIRSKYAEAQSLWNNAEDFWAVVGWAFNCSVKHKARWERWKVWLDQMLDVLQKDLEAHVASKEKQDVDFSETMLGQYLSTIGHGRNNQRKIMRAVMADGSKTSMNMFPEIWRAEPKPPKKQKEEPAAKRQKLDIDNSQYGDYFDSDSDAPGSEEGKIRRSRSATAPLTKSRESEVGSGDEEDAEDSEDELSEQQSSGHTIEAFGGQESIRLRQRFLTVLTRFASVAPALLVDASELFSIFTEFIRPLSLPVFQQFVLPIKPFLASNLQATFNEMLFQPLLGTNTPSYFITRHVLETTYAPHAAMNTNASDNAKVSLLTESLLRSLWKSGLLVGDLTSLRAAIETGVKARSDKVSFDGRKKKNAKVDHDIKSVLECSAQRMKVLLDLIEPQSTKSAQLLTIGSSQSDFEFDCTVCGAQGRNLNDGAPQVACGVCDVWQHTMCHGITPELASAEDFDFVCDKCKMPT